ncbi:hypothetical protein BJV78DRAFT_699905 [Lactifluus subvellereus]|nr:hypothetical protein BJV78DRAFT_699905 [Lactifluus subvellereus]
MTHDASTRSLRVPRATLQRPATRKKRTSHPRFAHTAVKPYCRSSPSQASCVSCVFCCSDQK